jgi:hypothetical protein
MGGRNSSGIPAAASVAPSSTLHGEAGATSTARSRKASATAMRPTERATHHAARVDTPMPSNAMAPSAAGSGAKTPSWPLK